MNDPTTVKQSLTVPAISRSVAMEPMVLHCPVTNRPPQSWYDATDDPFVPTVTLRRWSAGCLAGLALMILAGCSIFQQRPPIEMFASKLADEAIIPAVREGLSQGVEQLTIQAGAQGINPTYVVLFEGKWVVGVEGRVSVGVEGVAGQIQITSIGGEETETSPHAVDIASP